MQWSANPMKPYFIHNRTQKSYQMFTLRKCTILRKIAHFEFDSCNTSQQSWDWATKGWRRKKENNLSSILQLIRLISNSSLTWLGIKEYLRKFTSLKNCIYKLSNHFRTVFLSIKLQRTSSSIVHGQVCAFPSPIKLQTSPRWSRENGFG